MKGLKNSLVWASTGFALLASVAFLLSILVSWPFVIFEGYDVASAVRRFFQIKRFASLEFTAKSAFENFDEAMLLFQVLLLILILIIIVWVIRFLRTIIYARRIKNMHQLLSRLELVIVLLAKQKELPEQMKLTLELCKKEVVASLLQILTTQSQKGRFVSKSITVSHISILITGLQGVADDAFVFDDQMHVINAVRSMFSTF